MKLFYIALDRGCGIHRAKTATALRREITRKYGTQTNIKEVRVATPADIAWVRGMGGYVPSVRS